MKVVEVTTSPAYSVLIGSDLLQNSGRHIAAVHKPCTAVVVTDDIVNSLYAAPVIQSLTQAGFQVVSFVFPNGEQSKTLTTYSALLSFMVQHGVTRSDLIVALGGGVVGDLAGFAAATYLRGIRFVQVPTTLLAAVDSSVGGKTAIDLPAGKNLLGAFWQPSLVLCDIDTLSSLPRDVFLDGCAEVIKYGILYDETFFSYLESTGPDFDREAVIARCVEMKRDVVIEDEFDTGMRMKLNLGHTIGHGVEASSDFTLSHGKSVAIGMAIVSRASHCPDTARIIRILEKFGLPTTTKTKAETLYRYALSDKKRSGGTVNLVIPRAIGNCEIVPTPVEEVLPFIEEGL